MSARFAAPTQVPGRALRTGTVAVPEKQPSRAGIGKQTNAMPIGHLYPTQATTAAIGHDSASSAEDHYTQLFSNDENGKTIVQYARIYALDIATQHVNHYAETPADFKPTFDVATRSFTIAEIQGLPSTSAEWKARYGAHKIRIRVVGTYSKLSTPPGFLVTFSIEGSFGASAEQTFKPVFSQVLDLLELKMPEEPSDAPPSRDLGPPSVDPENAPFSG